MKNQLALFVVLFLFLVSCTSHSIQLEKKFKDDKILVKIDAKKSSSMDPWKVEMKVKAYDLQEGSLIFEHQVSKLTSNNIQFNWVNETICIIGFPYDNGEIRKFQLTVSPENYQLLEVSE